MRWHFLFKNNRTFITDNTNQAHEVHTLGQFKDDQFQGHRHESNPASGSEGSPFGTPLLGRDGGGRTDLYARKPLADDTNGTPRYGTTTHGKQMGVTYLIKAL